MASKAPWRMLEIAVSVPVFGSLVPAWSLYELYCLPFGTALRPMHLASELIVFGIGVPLLVVLFILAAFQSPGSDLRDKFGAWMISMLAIVLSTIPLFLLVPGIRWVAEVRGLIFKP